MSLSVRNTLFAALVGLVGIVPGWWVVMALSHLRNAILAPLIPYLSDKDGAGVLVGVADSILLTTVLGAVGILLVLLTRSKPSCLRNVTICLPVLSVGLSISMVCFGRAESLIGMPVEATTLFLAIAIFSYAFLPRQRRAVPAR